MNNETPPRKAADDWQACYEEKKAKVELEKELSSKQEPHDYMNDPLWEVFMLVLTVITILAFVYNCQHKPVPEHTERLEVNEHTEGGN